MRWFWLSFADPHLPKGEQFLGVSIVPVNEISYILATHDPRFAHDPFVLAVGIAKTLGLNPGGEVRGFEITDDIERVPEELRERLLTREELEAANLV